jgi:hypothetical protein
MRIVLIRVIIPGPPSKKFMDLIRKIYVYFFASIKLFAIYKKFCELFFALRSLWKNRKIFFRRRASKSVGSMARSASAADGHATRLHDGRG